MHTECLSQSQAVNTLFGTFPRFVGPIQRKVQSMPELLSAMTSQSGVMNSFVSVYSFQNYGEIVLDKLFLESDWKDPATALSVGQNLYEECTEKYKIPTVPIWSGNRSPHILPLFIPEVISNPSDTIKKVAYQITYSSNQYHIDPYTNKYVPYIDTRVLEPRRLCRFPNTRRITPSGTPSPHHCIILDPERFPDMSIQEVLDLSRSPQSNPIRLSPPTQRISDIYTNINLDEWQGNTTSPPTISPLTDSPCVNPSTTEYMLNSLIRRPCTRQGLNSPNPSHRVRCSAVDELHDSGVSESFTNYIFSTLNLFDYNPSTSAYHIHYNYEKGYKPYGKQAMQEEGLCNPVLTPNSPCLKCKK